MDLRPVGSGDRAQLASFRCATVGNRFSLEVEQEIRNDLADSLDAGTVEALGSWEGDRLVAVISYIRGEWWRVPILATDTDHRLRKQALRLKREVVRMATAAGARTVTSKVHEDNAPMLALNRKLGATVERQDPYDSPPNPYLVCTIALV